MDVPKLMLNKGFTLVELLITVLILTLLIFTGAFTYSMLASRWSKELGSFDYTVRYSRNLIQLKSLISGIYPYIVTDDTRRPSFFFVGGTDSLLSVSSSGIISSEPVIFKLSIEKKNSGSKLLYQSIRLDSLFLTSTVQEVVFENSIYLFDDIVDLNFSYFGWGNYIEKSESSVGGGGWSQTFSGIDRQLLPETLKLNVKFSDGELQFKNNYNTQSFKLLSPYLEFSNEK